MTTFPKSTCVACGSSRLAALRAKDYMSSQPETFLYAECQDCRTTFLNQAIEDLASCYPAGYYSLQSPHMGVRYRATNAILRLMLAVGLPRKKTLQLLPNLSPYYFLRAYSIRHDARILDVGSGTGRFVHRLGEVGYRNARGIDPYIPRDVQFDNGTSVTKCTLEKSDGRADVIFFNHSLEHVSDPLESLRQAAIALLPSGFIVVRIPLAASLAAGLFGTSWWQFDAPRHVTLFSARGFRAVAEGLGLAIQEVVFDSAGHVFGRSMSNVIRQQSLTSEHMRELAAATRKLCPGFRKMAVALNHCGLADQAMFILRRKGDV